MKESAQLMRAKARENRKKFDAYPRFVQRTLWSGQAEGLVPAWRQLPVEERLPIATRLKDEGNALYQEGQLEDAVEKYVQAAGLFHYVEQTGSSHEAAIDDGYLRLVTEDGDLGAVDDKPPPARELRSTCYSNIAQCLLRQQAPDYRGARTAADEALALNPVSVKALYRRALALEGIGTNPALADALRDLTAAEVLEPGSSNVREARGRIRAEQRRRAESEQSMFRGCFSKGHLGSDETSRPAAESSATVDLTDDEDIRRDIAAALRVREAALAEGCGEDARRAEATAERLKARLAERRARGVDVFNPTPDLLAEAREFGINLEDPDQQRRIDRAMWDVHEALEQRDRPQEPTGDLRRTLMNIVTLVALVWLLILARWYTRREA